MLARKLRDDEELKKAKSFALMPDLLGASLTGMKPESELSDASMLMMTSNLLIKGRTPQWACKWLAQTNWKLRILGSAALEAVQVAAGIAHAAITVNGKLWDLAAPAAIILEAGGILTDLAGKQVFPYDLTRYQGAKAPFLAAAPKAHPTLLQQIIDNP